MNNTVKELMNNYKTGDFKVLSGTWDTNIGKDKPKLETAYFLEVRDNGYLGIKDLNFNKDSILDWIAKEKSGKGRTILMARRYINLYCKNVKVVKVIK
jgi:hypothetical protein